MDGTPDVHAQIAQALDLCERSDVETPAGAHHGIHDAGMPARFDGVMQVDAGKGGLESSAAPRHIIGIDHQERCTPVRNVARDVVIAGEIKVRINSRGSSDVVQLMNALMGEATQRTGSRQMSERSYHVEHDVCRNLARKPCQRERKVGHQGRRVEGKGPDQQGVGQLRRPELCRAERPSSRKGCPRCELPAAQPPWRNCSR